MLSIVLDRRVGPSDLAPARLQGFARRRVLTDSFPMLVEDPNSHVDGAVFTARDQTDHDRVLFFEDFDYDLEPPHGFESGEEVEALYCGRNRRQPPPTPSGPCGRVVEGAYAVPRNLTYLHGMLRQDDRRRGRTGLAGSSATPGPGIRTLRE